MSKVFFLLPPRWNCFCFQIVFFSNKFEEFYGANKRGKLVSRENTECLNTYGLHSLSVTRAVILGLTYEGQTCTKELKLSSAERKSRRRACRRFNPGSSFIRSCFLYELQIITVDKSVSFSHPSIKKSLKSALTYFAEDVRPKESYDPEVDCLTGHSEGKSFPVFKHTDGSAERVFDSSTFLSFSG